MINVTSLRRAYLLFCRNRWLSISRIGLGRGLGLVLACGSANADDVVLVDLGAAEPSVVIEARYAGSHNFVGVPIEGYLDAKVLLTQPAIEALSAVQATLVEFGLGIKVFDGYRPQRAVDHFVRWASDLNDLATKAEFYPQAETANLFSDGYIAARSGHSRGSTVDLTLVDLKTGVELDMGTPWDFFDLMSWPSSELTTAEQRANRALLRAVMVAQKIRPLEPESWHFTLADEPFPDTYLDWVIE